MTPREELAERILDALSVPGREPPRALCRRAVLALLGEYRLAAGGEAPAARELRLYSGSANEPFYFLEGDRVRKKRTGAFAFSGVVLSCFRTRQGEPRYAVENADGVLLVFEPDDLEKDDTP